MNIFAFWCFKREIARNHRKKIEYLLRKRRIYTWHFQKNHYINSIHVKNV